ncbi:putative oxidoreductase [Lachnellula hyalina]|uniref:Putative oxidoreductase n=1 Tax=Lachnellula hyalina TaxID=1316788 RepID=A0A8H8R3R8_9HELO|nr:putative oxidoreductase [Lachnellula hyalina]TVY27833.1 putative oxidoreductase [Lachnellula hyalina]
MPLAAGAYVVTGSARGMGLELVTQFLSAGHTVVAASRNAISSINLNTLAASPAGERLVILDCDVGSPQSVEHFGAEIRKYVSSVDVLVNNAGISHELPNEDVSNVQPSSILDHININVVGTLLIAQAIAPLCLPGSKMINISSMCASLDLAPRRPIPNVVGYSISKAALNMLTVKQAMFYKKCVVVAVDPGNVKTDMNPDATNSVETVVGSLQKVVEGLRKEDSGSFVSWEGGKLSW